MLLRRFSLGLFLCVALAGCAQVIATPQEIEQRSLSFLRDGKTTKQEVILRLGIPSAQFQAERILAYRLSYNEQSKEVLTAPREVFVRDPRIAGWTMSQYNLVLVFDENDILRQHNFLKVAP